jgi:hypothetical protein
LARGSQDFTVEERIVVEYFCGKIQLFQTLLQTEMRSSYTAPNNNWTLSIKWKDRVMHVTSSAEGRGPPPGERLSTVPCYKKKNCKYIKNKNIQI